MKITLALLLACSLIACREPSPPTQIVQVPESASQPGSKPPSATQPRDDDVKPSDKTISAGSPRQPGGADDRRAVVFIRSTKVPSDGSSEVEVREGSGFVYAQTGYVITAGHVVFEEEEGFVVETKAAFATRSGNPYPLELVLKTTRPDIAVLQLPGTMDRDVQWLKLGDSRLVPVGARLYALGFPEGLEMTLVEGILSNRVGRNGNWQTTIPLNRGLSGGPIFNADGEVVAIAVAGNPSMQLVTYGIPAAHAGSVTIIAAADEAQRSAHVAVSAARDAYGAAAKVMDKVDVAARRTDTPNDASANLELSADMEKLREMREGEGTVQ